MDAGSLPVVVIIHDAWHTPIHYSRLIDMLTAQGFPTACPQLLTAHTEEHCTSNFNDDCSLIYQLVFDLASDGHEILVVAHGYGGFIASESLGELCQRARATRGLEGGVVGLVCLSAFLPNHGQTLKDCFGGDWPDNVSQQNDGTLILYQPGDVFYNDIGPMEREHWSNHLVRFTAKAEDITCMSGNPAWIHIQTTYAISEDNLFIPEDLQRRTIEACVANPGSPIDEELLEETGHCAMISAPERVLAVVVAAAAKAQTTIAVAAKIRDIGIVSYDGADGPDSTLVDDQNEPCQCGHGSAYAGSCSSSRISAVTLTNLPNDGTQEDKEDGNEYVGTSSSSRISAITLEDLPNESYSSAKHNCPCDGQCFCHYNVKYRAHSDAHALHPECPCVFQRRESYPNKSAKTSVTHQIGSSHMGTSVTDPLSIRDTFETAYENDYRTPENRSENEEEGEERDAYESWDSGLATIGSVSTTQSIETTRRRSDPIITSFGKDVESLDAEIEDDRSVRSELRRRTTDISDEMAMAKSEGGGGVDVDSNPSEVGSVQSEPRKHGHGLRSRGFVKKLIRKSTTFPMEH